MDVQHFILFSDAGINFLLNLLFLAPVLEGFVGAILNIKG